MENRAKQDALDGIAAAEDLEQLANSEPFKRTVQYLRSIRCDPEWLCHTCESFGLGDGEWLERVVKEWDGEKPLPRPKVQKREASRYGEGGIRIDVQKEKEAIAGKDSDAYAYSKHMLKGSPRVSWERSLNRDPLGDEWLTLKVRITRSLTQEGIAALARNSLMCTPTYQPTPTKPNLRSIACRLLNNIATRVDDLSAGSTAEEGV